LAGKLFYRLQMVDKDGRSTYSAIISINSGGNNNFTVTPQLITNNCEIKVSHGVTTQAAAVQITGIDGKVYLTKPVAKGSLQTIIPTNGFAKGNYLVVYINNGVRTAVQVVKL
jgi:hypothetical protein